jgi:hypothetical protein
VSATTVAPPMIAAPMPKMRPSATNVPAGVAPSGTSAVNSVANAVAPSEVPSVSTNLMPVVATPRSRRSTEAYTSSISLPSPRPIPVPKTTMIA